MEVILAKSAGFCFGVERAVEKVYEQLESGKKIYTYGPIIHNEEVVRDLESRGVSVIRDEKELRNPGRNRSDPFPRGAQEDLRADGKKRS